MTVGDLAQNEYQAIWNKRVVSAGGDGYTANGFILGKMATIGEALGVMVTVRVIDAAILYD